MYTNNHACWGFLVVVAVMVFKQGLSTEPVYPGIYYGDLAGPLTHKGSPHSAFTVLELKTCTTIFKVDFIFSSQTCILILMPYRTGL